MAQDISTLTANLFGMPYQFTNKVDHREPTVSKRIGKKYTETILLDAPICTIIPGEPRYMPNESKNTRAGMATALFSENEGFEEVSELLKDKKGDEVKLYDFKNNYTEYMKYVNVLCRAGAVLLGINDKININGNEYTFQKFDWRNYRWTTTATDSLLTRTKSALKSLKKHKKNAKTKDNSFLMETAGLAGNDDSGDSFANYSYVQFYVDASSDAEESASNETTDSMFKSLIDMGSDKARELQFLMNTTGLASSAAGQFVEGSAESLQQGLSNILSTGGAVTAGISRILNLSGEVLKGNNVILPSIYQSSSYSKSYSLTVNLRSPYGTTLGYYMDIFVPMMHLMALSLPRQESANSYGSPFLVKAYIDGTFSCNLGLVTSISVDKVADSLSVAGLPSEVRITLNIADLYSDLSLSPSSSPTLFLNNSSLIEWLATNCGVSIIAPNIDKKVQLYVSTYTNAITDIPSNVSSAVTEKISTWMNGLTGLYK
jgi:hypothetical protein